MSDEPSVPRFPAWEILIDAKVPFLTERLQPVKQALTLYGERCVSLMLSAGAGSHNCHELELRYEHDLEATLRERFDRLTEGRRRYAEIITALPTILMEQLL